MRPPLPPGPVDGLFGLRLAARLRDEPLAFVTELARRYGDLASFRLGPYRACAVNHPDLIREVLVSRAADFPKLPRVMRVLAQFDGRGLPVSDGDLWRRQRRLLRPAFGGRGLERCARVTVAATRRLLAGWADGDEVDAAGAMTRLTLDVLLKALFDAGPGPAEADAVCAAVGGLSEVLMRELGQPFALPDWLPLPGKRRKREALRVVDGFVRALVRARPAGGGGGDGLLALLLPGVGGAPEAEAARQARDEAAALLHAGHETTAAALAWTCFLLAAHPEIQEEEAREADAVLGGRAATPADLPRLPHVGAVVKESRRWSPPTWTLFPRQAVRDVELGGYRLPRGCWVFVFPFALHRDPRWFPCPERFDPRRFAPGREGRIPSCAYIPFGAGAHSCLGGRFAVTILTLVVVTVLRRFRLRLAPGQGTPEPEPFLALRSGGGVRVRLHEVRRGEPSVSQGMLRNVPG